MTDETILVASRTRVLSLAPDGSTVRAARGLHGHRPTCLAADSSGGSRVWCGTADGVLASDDAGRSFRPAGLDGEHVTALAASPAVRDLLWAGCEPTALFSSTGGGGRWERVGGLTELPSSSEWSFPPRPDTHHVRWIASHPTDAARLWLAVEAGALVSTADGGGSWRDRVPGGPYDTHELAIHPAAPDRLRVAAGDGYFESRDAGATWSSPQEGLEVGYLRSVAIDPGDPETVLVSGASGPGSAYVAGVSDGRLFRRRGAGAWRRVRNGWPEPPATIAPLLVAGAAAGELWAADERGLHRSTDGGRSWRRRAALDPTPSNLRGLARLSSSPRLAGDG